jgi:hypothetical protein
MTDRARLGRRSKTKGKSWEKAVEDAIAVWMQFGEGDVVSTKSGTDECDIGLSPAAQKRFPFWVECKNTKTLAFPAWIRQTREAIAKARSKLSPIVVFKQHGDSTGYVIIEFSVFMQLVSGFMADRERYPETPENEQIGDD